MPSRLVALRVHKRSSSSASVRVAKLSTGILRASIMSVDTATAAATTPTPTITPTVERINEIRRSLTEVNDRIAAVSKDRSSKTRLVAVSKVKPASDVMAAYECGQRHFGENYVNELVEKSQLLPADIRWHFIGGLQSNKCKILAKIPNLSVVESIDSVKTADTLHKACAGHERSCTVYIQVNTSGEESKGGVAPDECLTLARHIKQNCTALLLGGLMTIGAKHDDSDLSRNPDFQALSDCKSKIESELSITDLELSMGMSDDFEQAVRQGSTNVRVGSTIFGERDYGSAKLVR